jgi:hypothetical protein
MDETARTGAAHRWQACGQESDVSLVVAVGGVPIIPTVTTSKSPGRNAQRRSPAKRRATSAHPARPPVLPTVFTEQWFDSWRRANALGWEYLNAVSGLARMNFDALTSATRFMTPFRAQ